MSDVEVTVSADADSLASAVADRAVATLRAALADHGTAHLVVTGGGILEQVQAAMADPNALDWSRVHIWWGDERFVPADSDDRNDLPEQLGALPAIVHRMAASGADYGDDVDAAARGYAVELAGFAGDGGAVPAFDVALIGLGPDGHCCSLFPHHPVLGVVDVSVSAVRDSPKPPPTRLTLTFPTLDAVRELWFIASGDGKADAVAKAVGGASTTAETPSGTPRGTTATRWLIDRAAASQLPEQQR